MATGKNIKCVSTMNLKQIECYLLGLGQLSQGGVSMGGFGQSLGQLNQSSGLSPALPISTAAASTVYQAHYGLNSLGKLE